ncbi:hypothetical protein IEQ34_019122 [Dendrobium chrysotoxum]|uniref:Pollen Ole e 1 allergen and extensin family protein n=1 Tax=Dendrobium chrysotoxum TaxID=161865 RepID=A0AAV7G7N9_DENCH|nr:hypothetical protein IEQ34_019122 [Dendrobium chrysotoxum]
MTSSFEFILRILLPLFLLLKAGVISVNGDALVTGTVFCDQCKDGSRGFFDYPLSGAKVAVSCGDQYKEESSNFMGSYTVRFEGSPDLSGCSARVVRGPEDCGAAAGPAQGLKFMFRIFDMEAYTVDPLLSQPSKPMSFCSHSGAPTKPKPTPPAIKVPPPVSLSRPPPAPPRSRSPAIPFLEASACSYDKWLMPAFKCYWKVVSPETPVALAFGPVAAGKYGPDLTLLNGLYGRGDLYRTLLREATAALLNSYNSIRFPYPTLSVVSNMNSALLGSQREALMTALRFRRANSGISGRSTLACNFTPCS